MTEGDQIWKDGTLLPAAEATVHVLSNVAARGTQVFDVLVLTRTDTGPAVVGLDEHLIRFQESAAEMGMEDLPNLDQLRRAVFATVDANVDRAATNAVIVKIMANWEDNSVGAVPDELRPVIYVATLPTDEDRLPTTPDGPISVRTADMPKIPATVLPPSVKVAASYTPAIRQQILSRRQGYDHTLFKTFDGYLAESMTSSVFAVADGRLLVPPLEVVLNGVTRRIVLDAAEAAGVECTIGPVPWETVLAADEFFFSSTVHPVTTVDRLDERTLATPGPVSAALASVIEQIYLGTHPLSERWLTRW
jgi:branched-chain amino acid aminotransferase